jgi:hypothetical protein
MAPYPNGGFAPWAFATDPSRRDLHVKMATPND